MAKKRVSKILTLLGFDEQTEDTLDPRDELPVYTRPEPPANASGDRRSGGSSGDRGARRDERVADIQSTSSSTVRMVVYQPQNFEDTQTIIDSPGQPPGHREP